jgi:pimeloyl-ACP methyl ester carboxylesterase
MTKETLILIPGTLCDHTLFAHQVAALSDLVNCQVVDSSREDELGAMFEIMRRFPERVNKLILLHTNYKQASETTIANQERWVGMACLGRFEEITTRILTDLMLHPDHAKDPRQQATLLKMARTVGKEGFIRQVKAQQGRPDSTRDLANITCPVLLVTGQQDIICPVALHQEMAGMIPRARLEIIEHCGHLSTLEQPQVVNRHIRQWWQSQIIDSL